MASPRPSQPSSRTSTGALSQQPTLIGGGAPPPRPAGAALTRAINEFRNRLTGAELNDFKVATYPQLCKELMDIQKKQEDRKETMNLARIRSCLEAMQQFGQVIEIFLNVSDAVAFVWGPMKFLLLVSSSRGQSHASFNGKYRQPVRLQILSNCFWMHTNRSASSYLCYTNTNHCFTTLPI
jgi:hypothetical protein